MASARRVQHVDGHAITCDLRARIQYLHSFLDFNASDIAALTHGSKYLRPSLSSIVERVYRKLLQYDITASSFAQGSTSYTGPVDACPAKTSPQVQYRKLFLQGYLQKICSDPSKFEFWEYLDKVGRRHACARLSVDYVHLGITMGFIHDCLVEETLLHPRLKMERKLAIVKALNKVCWIQNDLFARWHVMEGEDSRPRKGSGAALPKNVFSPGSEREGFLHGRMVIDPDGLSPVASAVDTPIEELACPFTAIMEKAESLKLTPAEAR